MTTDARATFVFQLSSSLLASSGKADGHLNLQAVFSARGLRELSLCRGEFVAPLCRGLEQFRDPRRVAAGFELLKDKLMTRLGGGRAGFEWREFDLSGRPDFYLHIWKAMHALPFGSTATYGQIARAAGSPQAVRACGRACGANPILIFIPCHRVVSASGLGGFGCGVEWKKRLLALEGVDWRKLQPG